MEEQTFKVGDRVRIREDVEIDIFLGLNPYSYNVGREGTIVRVNDEQFSSTQYFIRFDDSLFTDEEFDDDCSYHYLERV